MHVCVLCTSVCYTCVYVRVRLRKQAQEVELH